jgi:hypothetical protein
MIEPVPAQQKAVMRRYLESIPYPDSLPLFDTFLVDDLGNLWVRSFPMPGSDSVTWNVFAEAGTRIGSITLPVLYKPLHIGADFVVFSSSREDGAQTVSVFALRRLANASLK